MNYSIQSSLLRTVFSARAEEVLARNVNLSPVSSKVGVLCLT